MPTELLDPKNDYVFKRLLADSPRLLASLINAVRYDCPPVEVERVLNPTILPQELEGKTIVLDVLVQDASGQRFNVEMQARRHPDWRQRSVFYLAGTMGGQLASGEDYTQLRAAVGIHLLDFDLYEEPDQAVWRFHLRDQWRPQKKYGDELELNVLEMRKAMALGGQPEAIAVWVAFFERWNEEVALERIDDEVLREAILEARRRLSDISCSEEDRIRAMLREKAIRDEISWRNWAERTGREAGLKQGLAEGRAQGLDQGRTEGEAHVLERLLSRRFGPLPETVVARLRGAGLDALERWTDRILEARTLDEVFAES